MANYYGASRTNLFKVTDENRYQELFKNLVSEDKIDDFSQEINGETYHGFGTFDCILYINPETEEYDMDEFFEEIQKILPENEAFVYYESGHEKLRYVSGYACIVTKDEIKDFSLESHIVSLAKEMLGADYHISMDENDIPVEMDLD